MIKFLRTQLELEVRRRHDLIILFKTLLLIKLMQQ